MLRTVTAQGIIIASLTFRCLPLTAAEPPPGVPARPNPVTFTQHIAPILFDHCAVCHRPNQTAPFSLLSYPEVKKRSKLIAEVTMGRLMPPWLPEPGPEKFANQRLLTQNEIKLIQAWIRQGAIEGNPAALPPLPSWPEGWHLGKPDLILEMPQPYALGPEGPDVYRNFVIPAVVSKTCYVKAFEFRPGNPKVVHHATIQIDRTSSSRLLDEKDSEAGFPGLMTSRNVQLPDGQFLGWTPGKTPAAGSDKIAWRLDPGTDLVLQLHMQPSGKPETIRSSIGLYFADHPPVLHPYTLVLRNKQIDIPAGSSNYLVRASYRLPVEVTASSIYPHAHYLARQMKVSARFPDGAQKRLIEIAQWDFNWQDEYRYLTPIFLPQGTEISFEYHYDNSAGNPRNPSQPPQRVVYGRNSTDEMAEVLLQVFPKNRQDLAVLQKYSAYQELLKDIQLSERRLRENPRNTAEHVYVGGRYLEINRPADAIGHFREAVALAPGSARARYLLGDALAQTSNFDQALIQLEAAIELDNDDPDSLTAAAKVLATHPKIERRDPARAIRLAERAASLTANRDVPVLYALSIAYAAGGEFDRATEAAERALRLASSMQNDEAMAQINRRLQAIKEERKK